MTDIEKKLAQFRRAYEAGILDEGTYNAVVEKFKADAGGVEIDAEGDVSIVKDPGKAQVIKGSQAGIIGDNAKVEGGIHLHGKADAASLRRRYLKDLAAETDRLPWGKLSPDKAGPDQGKVIRLSDVYTALDTTEMEWIESEDDIRHMMCRDEEQKRISTHQMINDHKHLVLLGDPGSGKTTLVNFVTHTFACAGVSAEPDESIVRLQKIDPWAHGALLPVRVILRDFATWLVKKKEDGEVAEVLVRFIHNSLEVTKLDEFWTELHIGLQAEDTELLILLDGLDEVPAGRRRQVVGIIRDFTEKYEHNRYLATCRIYAYLEKEYRLDRFREAVLSPFSDEQIGRFIHAWFVELREQKQMQVWCAEEHVERLKLALEKPELRDLARRPLLMTIIALLHTSYGQLPEDRVELYQWTVDLLLRRWKKGEMDGRGGLMEALDMPQLRMSDLEAGLFHVAFEAQAGAGKEETADIADTKLLKQLKPYFENSWDKAETFVKYIRERAGLLICHKPDVYTFPHRTFQEFMAACHLVGMKNYSGEAVRLLKKDPDRWRIVFILSAGHARRTHQLETAIDSVSKLCRFDMDNTKQSATTFNYALIAGEALLEIGLAGVKRDNEGMVTLARVKQWLLAAMQAGNILEPAERVHAGNILSQLGDPRFNSDTWYLPDVDRLGFVEIPAGEFLMGSTKEHVKQFISGGLPKEVAKREIPHHMVELSSYAIAKYPVTVAQYRIFTEETGRKPDDEWRKINRFDNHPVVLVTWHDAIAYCKWLTEKLKDQGWRINLPTEAQWEKAARGTHGWIYPWENKKIDPNRANYKDTGIGASSPVGCFPDGNTQDGLTDMAGNVWEWCQDLYGEYRSDKGTDPTGPENGLFRVVRGGSCYDPARHCRAARRSGFDSDYRLSSLGFRLVLPGQERKVSQQKS